jgi:hypothetical protein
MGEPISCTPSSILSKREFVRDRLIEDEIYLSGTPGTAALTFMVRQTPFHPREIS